MSEYPNITEALIAHAAGGDGDRVALVLLPDPGGPAPAGGADAETIGYARLDLAARRLAGWLQDHGARGEPVVVLQASGRLFAESLLACLYAGAVAVPVPAPDRGRVRTERMLAIVRDAAARIVLTDAAHAPEVSRLLAGGGNGAVLCAAVDGLDTLGLDPLGLDPERWRMPDLSGDRPALLQYTSGTTGRPRGVVVTHRALAANQRTIRRALGTTRDSRIGGWLPLHHDMGLVGQLLHPLWLGATSVLMPPQAFAARPLSWLEMIDRHGVTVSGAPDFAYRLCIRAAQRLPEGREASAGLDLSRWETAVDGAEPIRPDTLDAFARAFAPAGLRPEALRPCYGLAEATLLVTASPPGAPPSTRTVDAAAFARNRLAAASPGAATRTLVSCGVPQDATLRITDPGTGRTLPDGEVGEIRVRGESVAAGYWRAPGETAVAFPGGGVPGRPGCLRTGDLGAVVEGELYVTGRLKEVMIVRGRNIHPHEVERAAQPVSPHFACAVAFPVGTEGDRVVLVQEVRTARAWDLDLPGLAAQVRHRVGAELEVPLSAVVLVRPGTVRRTSSGKPERNVVRHLLLRGELDPLYEDLDPVVRDVLTAGREEAEGHAAPFSPARGRAVR